MRGRRNNLGALLWERASVREATNCFRRAVRDDASLESARLNLALALFRQGHLQLALDAYRSGAAGPSGSSARVERDWRGCCWSSAITREPVMRAFARLAVGPDVGTRAFNAQRGVRGTRATCGCCGMRAAAYRLDARVQPQTMILEMDSPETYCNGSDTWSVGAAVPDYTLGRDYLSKGLHDRATAEIRRALARGADEKEGMVFLARCLLPVVTTTLQSRSCRQRWRGAVRRIGCSGARRRSPRNGPAARRAQKGGRAAQVECLPLRGAGGSR